MRVALVQLQSGTDVAANLASAEGFVAEAARAGAAWVLLPEMFAYLRREGQPFPHAQTLDGAIVTTLRAWARRHKIWLLGGSFAEVDPSSSRVFNCSVLINSDGKICAVYRKMHLFDVDLRAQGGGLYEESASIAAGAPAPVLARTPFGGVGLSVCYDMRFPELYRQLTALGARFLTVPSAFAPQTGRAHWEVLLRARAIENQCFVLAPAQCGTHSPERSSYGHSIAVDPWGTVLAQAADAPGVTLAECDTDAQTRLRETLPVLKHRRL